EPVEDPLFRAISPERVEALQDESNWIHLRMAAMAGFVLGLFLVTLPRRHVRADRRRIERAGRQGRGGRLNDLVAKDTTPDDRASENGVRVLRSRHEKRRAREHPGALRARYPRRIALFIPRLYAVERGEHRRRREGDVRAQEVAEIPVRLPRVI